MYTAKSKIGISGQTDLKDTADSGQRGSCRTKPKLSAARSFPSLLDLTVPPRPEQEFSRAKNANWGPFAKVPPPRVPLRHSLVTPSEQNCELIFGESKPCKNCCRHYHIAHGGRGRSASFR